MFFHIWQINRYTSVLTVLLVTAPLDVTTLNANKNLYANTNINATTQTLKLLQRLRMRNKTIYIHHLDLPRTNTFIATMKRIDVTSILL